MEVGSSSSLETKSVTERHDAEGYDAFCILHHGLLDLGRGVYGTSALMRLDIRIGAREQRRHMHMSALERAAAVEVRVRDSEPSRI